MKRSTGGKRHIASRSGKLGIKGPMAHQRPSGLEAPDRGRKTKGRIHWEPRAQ